MSLTNLALNAIRPKAQAFARATRDPIKTQNKTLFEYLRRNKDTEYGKKYGFSKIHSIEEYRSRVPLTDYETLRPYIEKMANGRNNILTKDKCVFFGITSGTTGKPKLIPVTKYSRNKKADMMKLWAYYIHLDHPRVVSSKVFAIISPEIKSHTPAGIPYGPEDGHAYNNLPGIIKNLYCLPYKLFYIKDYDARYYCMLRMAMEHNVTTVATLNPSTFILLCQRIARVQDDIIKDIEKGTLNKDLDIPADIRRQIEKQLKPNRRRAGELRAILKSGRPLYPKYFWPHLELIECWKGGTVKLYLKELPKYFGDVAIRDFGCLSTEARSSVPVSDEGAGGVLAIETNFYEFVPRGDMASAKKTRRFLLCDELERGQEYYLIVTTPGGLYRYNIDDVIKVDGFFNKTPMIEFVQKGHNAVSLTGEKVYESHINEAVNAAAGRNKMPITFFAASVERGDPDRYIFLAEFNGDVPLEKKRALLHSIEEELCRQNSEYKDIREQQLLGHPVLKVVKPGEFERYRAVKVAEGRHDGQFKMPELVGDFDFHKNFAVMEEIAP